MDSRKPLTAGVEELIGRIETALALHNEGGPLASTPMKIPAGAYRALVDAKRLLSDLTRRLAEAEECLTIAHMDGYHKGLKAGQSEHNNSVRMGQYILEAKTEKRLREDAEARVRELDATIDAIAEAHAHDDQALTAAYLNGAHAGKKQAEAERDALRERCRKLDAEIKLITNSYKAEHDEVIRLRMHNTTESAK